MVILICIVGLSVPLFAASSTSINSTPSLWHPKMPSFTINAGVGIFLRLYHHYSPLWDSYRPFPPSCWCCRGPSLCPHWQWLYPPHRPLPIRKNALIPSCPGPAGHAGTRSQNAHLESLHNARSMARMSLPFFTHQQLNISIRNPCSFPPCY